VFSWSFERPGSCPVNDEHAGVNKMQIIKIVEANVQAARLLNLNAMGLKAKIIEHYSTRASPSSRRHALITAFGCCGMLVKPRSRLTNSSSYGNNRICLIEQ
jgi:hypothetical protein